MQATQNKRQQNLSSLLDPKGVDARRRLLRRIEERTLALAEDLARLNALTAQQVSELAVAQREGKVGDVTMHSVPRSVAGSPVGEFVKYHINRHTQPGGVYVRKQPVGRLVDADPLS